MEAPDSLFKAPRLQLGRFWNDFFQIFGQNAQKATNAKNACQNKTSMTNAPRVGGRRCSLPGGFQWNWSQVGRFGIQRLLGSWQFAETVPSHRTPASGWAFPGLARFRPHFSSFEILGKSGSLGNCFSQITIVEGRVYWNPGLRTQA